MDVRNQITKENAFNVCLVMDSIHLREHVHCVEQGGGVVGHTCVRLALLDQVDMIVPHATSQQGSVLHAKEVMVSTQQQETAPNVQTHHTVMALLHVVKQAHLIASSAQSTMDGASHANLVMVMTLISVPALNVLLEDGVMVTRCALEHQHSLQNQIFRHH